MKVELLDMKPVQVIALVVLVGVWGAGCADLVNAEERDCRYFLSRLRPCVDVIDTQCEQAEKLLQPCLLWVIYKSNNYSLLRECCSALAKVYKKSLTCFCLLTFSPPPHGNNTFQFEAPRLCNVTTNLCETCTRPIETALRETQFTSDSKCASLEAQKNRWNYKHAKILAWSLSVSGGLLLGTGLLCILTVRKKRRLVSPQLIREQEAIERIEGRPTIFAYNVLKVATSNFNQENKLGEGGFGDVFKGVLPDGTEVAVKRLLTKSRQGKQEFLNEVTLITSVQHRNLVKLKGCCLKGEERLLVYEFLEHRSLHQALFDSRYPVFLDWPTRLKIALGTARGLAYLHEGCRLRIIHRDVKASNILLDKDLEPKLSDFGLAKLIHDTQSHVSTRVAGTVGYLAPEYALRGQLTEKADVFSYGIVLLELLSGRTNLDLRLPTDMAYLLDWIWQLHEEERLMDILDPRLKAGGAYEKEILRVAEIALLCTQTATLRPTMSTVATMLAGESEVVVPTLIRPSIRHFEDLLGHAGSYGRTSRSEPLESPDVFKSSSASSSNYISKVEPR